MINKEHLLNINAHLLVSNFDKTLQLICSLFMYIYIAKYNCTLFEGNFNTTTSINYTASI